MFNGKLRTVSIIVSIATLTSPLLAGNVWSGDRGFHDVAGEHSRHRDLRRDHRRAAIPLVIMYSDDFENDDEDFSESFLREKVTIMHSRSGPKILQVTQEQFVMGESRAARREQRMLDNFENIDIRYYRPNEAYDVRFPSVVYLDSIRK